MANELAPDRDPWAQQPTETDLSYARFKAFRDANPESRKLIDVAQKLVARETQAGTRRPPSVASIMTLAGRWRWTERARAFDARTDTEVQAEHVEAKKDYVREQLRLSTKILQRVELELDMLLVGEATHTEIARYFDIAVKVQRQCLGLDQQKVELSGPGGKGVPVSLEGLDPAARAQELAELDTLLASRIHALNRASNDDDD